MGLRFAYQRTPVPKAVIALGGRWVRPRPIIEVAVSGPTGSHTIEGKLDTGADDTLLPEVIASLVGVDLTNAPSGQVSRVGQRLILIRYAQVILRITDGIKEREWTAWVGFTATPLKRPLLGFAGFLQFFTATFHGDREEVELSVNSLYRGT